MATAHRLARVGSKVGAALWKSLGTGRGQAVRIAQFYAQKSSFDARKLLVGQRDSAIIDVARESVGPLIGRPRAHLAVGSGQEIRAVRRRARREAGFSGRCGRRVTARVVSRRAPRARPGHWATLAACPGGDAAPDRQTPLPGARRAVGGRSDTRGGAEPDPSPGRHRRRRRPARTPQAMGASPSARGPGSRQRFLERRQRRLQERPGASLLSARCWRNAPATSPAG
jgi:hypothetical protein